MDGAPGRGLPRGRAGGFEGELASTAGELDTVRLTVDAADDDKRTIPAGMRGVVLDAKPDGSCLVEVASSPQTDDADGDFAQCVLAAGQYEVVHRHS